MNDLVKAEWCKKSSVRPIRHKLTVLAVILITMTIQQKAKLAWR